MSVSISGILLDPFGQPASFAEVKFITWQGANDVLTTAPAVFKTSADGAYSFAVEFGTFTVQVRYNQSNGKFQTIKQKVVVNSNVTATTLGELLLFNEPLTPPEIAYVEQLVAEAEGYRDEAEGFALASEVSSQTSEGFSQASSGYADDANQSAIDAANSAALIAPVPLNGGVWASGQTYDFYNQYMIYNGEAYSPLPATVLPYTVGAVPDLGFVYQIKLNDHALLANLNADGGHDAIYHRTFSTVQEMIDYTDLIVGSVYSTGGTEWQYSGGSIGLGNFKARSSVYLEDWGVPISGDDTDNIIEALNLGGHVYAKKDHTYVLNEAKENLVTKFVSLHMQGATFSFTQSKEFAGIEFTAGANVYGGTWDGNGNMLAAASARSAFFRNNGLSGDVEDCVFKNLTATVTTFPKAQYAISLNQHGKMKVARCIFDEVHSSTDGAGASGFSGGIFISTDQLNLGQRGVGSHLVEDCKFTNIYSLPNGGIPAASDSDAIRNFMYEADPVLPQYADTIADVEKSVLTVNNCTSIDVLKSMVKASYTSVLIDNCHFNIEDDRGQNVFAAFRVQGGPGSFTCTNSSAKGLEISNGIVGACKEFTVDNFIFDSTKTASYAIQVGGADSKVASISNLYIVKAGAIMTVFDIPSVTLRNVTIEDGGLMSHFVQHVNDPTEVKFESSNMGVQGVKFNFQHTPTASTMGRLILKDVDFTSTFAGPLFDLGLNNLTITGDSKVSCYRFSVFDLDSFLMEDSSLTIEGTQTGSYIAGAIGDFDITDAAFIDNRVIPGRNGTIDITGVEKLRVHNTEFVVTTGGFGFTAIVATGNGITQGSCVFSNVNIESTLDLSGITAKLTGFRSCIVSDMSVLLPNANNGVLDVQGNGKAVVNGYSGDFKVSGNILGADATTAVFSYA